ncbi:response regulator [Halodesulfovibrio sp.]|uniref:response regulator n=1 Tax=Halodesulfovibrio sp. TaxID=1912772 RepID=UPI0025BDA776|nr:response regulator [Halodesulfovibrio sp.]
MQIFKKLSMRSKIFITFIMLVLVLFGSIYLAMPHVKSTFENTLKKEIESNTVLASILFDRLLDESVDQYLKGVVETGAKLAQTYYNDYTMRKMSLGDAQRMARSVIDENLIGDIAYAFIIDEENCCDIKEIVMAAPNKDTLSSDFVEQIIAQKNGVLRIDKGTSCDSAYLSYFRPWKWIIAAVPFEKKTHSIVSLTNFRDRIENDQLSPAKGSYITIFELDGYILYHPFLANKNALTLKDPKTKRFFIQDLVDKVKANGVDSVQKGWFTYHFVKREDKSEYGDKLFYYVYDPANKWFVVTVLNKEDMLIPYHHLLVDLQLVAVLALITVVLLAFLSSNHLISRIDALKKAARKLSENDYDFELKKRSDDEIGELEDAFNEASTKIQSLTNSQRALNENLEKIVEERTDALHLALQEAQGATEAKSEFLANMSHEIRTPINAITGLTYLMQQQDAPPQQKRYITKIETAAHSLLGIINDILDFSKIEAGKLDLENTSFYLHDVMEKVSTIVGMKASEKGLDFIISYEPNVPMTYMGDPLRLAQVITNLVNNAIKFTEKGEVGVYISRERRHLLRFEVRDTGIGLSEEEISKLFKSFSQADTSTTRKYGGTGLGLAISKQLVQMMGGYIWVQSTKGKGASFFFTVTLKEVSSRNNDHILFTNKRVLIVDDSPSWQSSLSNLLSVYNFEIDVVGSGEEAVAKVKNSAPYDLVLMDWNLPGANGVETSHMLKHMLPSEARSIIMVSSYDEEYFKREAEREGILTFLHKPVNPSELYNLVMSYFGSEVKNHIDTKVEKISLKEELTTRKGSRLLLVEDNEVNRDIIKDMLAHSGILIDEAHNGLEAVEKVEKAPEKYELVLMDIQMPVMDGYTATRRIREITPVLPIVALTANAMAADIARSKEAGMNGHLNKPINVEEFFTTLLQYLTPKVKDRAEIPTEEVLQPPVMFKFSTIDAEAGLKYMNGDMALYHKILRNFLSTYEDANESLRKLLVENKKEAKRLLHTLKGLSASIGATDLHLITKELEVSFDNSLLNSFGDELDKVLKDIKECPELAQQNDKQSDLPLLEGNIRKNLWRSLYEAIKSKRPKNIKGVLEKFTPYALSKEDSEKLAEVRGLLDKFKYNDALNLLGESDE